MRRFLPFLMIALAACAEPPADGDTTTPADSAAPAEVAADTGMIFNTPDGGALDWVSDIDAGLDSVPALAGVDPAAAQNRVLNLYVTRQEYLEGYYGPNGRLRATPELAAAIKTNETRFHALMQELSKDSPDPARAATLTDSLEAQVDRVRAAVEAVGHELTPWSGEGS